MASLKVVSAFSAVTFVFQIVAFLAKPEVISTSKLKDDCRLDPVKADESGSPSLYFMTKDNQEELVKNNDIKEVEVNEKQACKEKCGAGCKGIGLAASDGSAKGLYDGCFTFTEEIEHFIETKKIQPFSERKDDEDSLTLWNVVCGDENKIGGGGGGNGVGVAEASGALLAALAALSLAANWLR